MDIAIIWDTLHFRGDWAVRPSDLQIDPGGLRSAVLLSLFTDRVAPPGYQPPPGSKFERHGWWGDTFEDEPIGSLLWTLNRRKKTDGVSVLVEAEDICRQALEWLLRLNIAASVDVRAGWQANGTLALLIRITKPDGTLETFNYDYAWQGV